MRIIFFSSSHRALPAFQLLHKNTEIVGVVSQPDRPIGRKQKLTETAIANYAKEQNIPLLKPETLDREAIDWIAEKKPEVLLLSYYGLLVPPELFNLTPSGILVTHPSLLPKWRWGSPVQATILSGEKETGVSLMKMDEKFDHGPVIAVEKTEVGPQDDQESLYTRLFTKGAELALKVLPEYLAGKITPQSQDHTKATFASHIKKEDGYIPPEYFSAALNGKAYQNEWVIRWMKDTDRTPFILSSTPENLERFVRAMSPWPGAFTKLTIQNQEKRLKILKAHCEEDKFVPDEVQLEGKTPVSWKQFVRTYPTSGVMQ